MPHITTDPISRSAELSADVSRFGQERDCGIQADNGRSTLCECERMSSVSTADVNNA